VGAPTGRFFTTTGVSLAFPVSSLREVAQNGRGTTFNIEYRIRPRFSIAGAWDANVLPIQTTKLVAALNPALKLAIKKPKRLIRKTVGESFYGRRFSSQLSLQKRITRKCVSKGRVPGE